jgi:hypothetical protein
VPDRPQVLLRLVHSLARLDALDPLPHRLCRAVVDVSSARDGAMSLGVTATERTLLCASSEYAARFEDAQDLAQEGPALEVLSSGLAVVSHDGVETRRRWPGLVGALGDEEGALVRSLPMRPGSSLVGVMTVHHVPSSAAPSFDVSDLQFLADAVGAALVGDQTAQHDPSRMWSERDRISQATGMVVVQLALGPDDALAVLRAHAFAQAVSLAEISRRVIARELDFRTGLGEGGA